MGILAAGAAAGASGGCTPGEGEGETPRTGEAATGGAGSDGTGPTRPLGVQLYTLRGPMEEDAGATLARVAEIGYREVEFAGYHGHAPSEVRELLDRAGLSAPAAHVPLEALEGEAAGPTLAAASTVGHEWLVVAWVADDLRSSADAWRRTAARLQAAGERVGEAGLRFAYHNHDFEFAEIDGELPMDILLETDPERVHIELDLYWILHGGGDPMEFLDRRGGRVPMVHVKGRAADGSMVDVGAGTVDWGRLLRGRPALRHLFVEHDHPPDPFESVRTGLAHLERLGLTS